MYKHVLKGCQSNSYFGSVNLIILQINWLLGSVMNCDDNWYPNVYTLSLIFYICMQWRDSQKCFIITKQKSIINFECTSLSLPSIPFHSSDALEETSPWLHPFYSNAKLHSHGSIRAPFITTLQGSFSDFHDFHCVLLKCNYFRLNEFFTKKKKNVR